MDISSVQLIQRLKTTIKGLQNTITEFADSASTVTMMHREMLSELRSQLDKLEKSHASMKSKENGHMQEIAAMGEKISAVTESGGHLKMDDLDETIYMLLIPIKELESQYLKTHEAWKKDNDKDEAHAKDLIMRAQALLSHAKQAVDLERAVRTTIESKLKQRYRDQIATSLLEDGVLVWVSQTNLFAILMTECLIQIEGYQLTIAPTQLCFDTHSVLSLYERYHLDHTSIDMTKSIVTIELRDIDEVKYVKRRANIPGTSDESSPHWEAPKHHQCVFIRTHRGKEYFLADRKNESRDKTWGSIQGASDGSPSLLCQKLTDIWQRARRTQP